MTDQFPPPPPDPSRDADLIGKMLDAWFVSENPIATEHISTRMTRVLAAVREYNAKPPWVQDGHYTTPIDGHGCAVWEKKP